MASTRGLDQFAVDTGRRLHRVEFEGTMIAIGGDHLWALESDGTLRRMNPDDGEQDGSVELNQSVGSLVAGADAVWVGGGARGPGLTRVDPSSSRASWAGRFPPS